MNIQYSKVQNSLQKLNSFVHQNEELDFDELKDALDVISTDFQCQEL